MVVSVAETPGKIPAGKVDSAWISAISCNSAFSCALKGRRQPA
jgi:hypothetical protein